MPSNMGKYDSYKAMKVNLKKAMRAGFYYQAIFIEYAIIEDRCASVLRHAGIKCDSSNGREIRLSDKLRKMERNPAFANPFVRKKIPVDLILELRVWKDKRDQLIHALAKIPYDHDSIKEIATDGEELVRSLDNAVRSVNNYHEKH